MADNDVLVELRRNGWSWTGTLVDSTLTKEGVAAEGKATGEAIDSLKESVADNSEQILESAAAIEVETNKLLSRTGKVADYTSSAYYVTTPIPVDAGKTYYISAAANYGNGLYAFYDADDVKITVGAAATGSAFTTLSDEPVVAPEEAATLRISGNSNAGVRALAKVAVVRFVDKEARRITERVATGLHPDVYDVMPLTASNELLIGASGYPIESAGNTTYWVSDAYDVVPGGVYYITAKSWYAKGLYAFYNADGIFISGEWAEDGSTVTSIVDAEIVAPENAASIRIADKSGGSFNGALKVALSYTFGGKKWEAKKWACIGDSLTESNSRTPKNYHGYIYDSTGIEVVNLGVSGTGYANGLSDGTSFGDRVTSIPEDTDVVTFFGSGNDLSTELEIGTASDTETTTICGCVNKALDDLFALYPLMRVGIVTPTPWQHYPPSNAENRMALYSQALVDICKARGIPCLDLYHCSGLRPWEASYLELAYSRDDGNGTHPDENGHALIAPRFKAFLETLLM